MVGNEHSKVWSIYIVKKLKTLVQKYLNVTGNGKVGSFIF